MDEGWSWFAARDERVGGWEHIVLAIDNACHLCRWKERICLTLRRRRHRSHGGVVTCFAFRLRSEIPDGLIELLVARWHSWSVVWSLYWLGAARQITNGSTRRHIVEAQSVLLIDVNARRKKLKKTKWSTCANFQAQFLRQSRISETKLSAVLKGTYGHSILTDVNTRVLFLEVLFWMSSINQFPVSSSSLNWQLVQLWAHSHYRPTAHILFIYYVKSYSRYENEEKLKR